MTGQEDTNRPVMPAGKQLHVTAITEPIWTIVLPLLLLALPGQWSRGIHQPMANHQVRLQGMSFVPEIVLAQPGDTVEWIWESDGLSTTADDGSWDSGVRSQPCTFTHTFDKAGDYPYFCSTHGGPGGAGMSAMVQVTEAEQNTGQRTA